VPFIRNIYVASLTSTLPDSGSDSELVLIMNRGGLDVIQRTWVSAALRRAAASSSATTSLKPRPCLWTTNGASGPAATMSGARRW